MERVIRITGEGRVSVAPDTIELSFVVAENDMNEQTALQKADKKICELKEIFAKLGIDEKRVITKNFSINQKTKSVRNKNGDWEYLFDGYAVNYSMTVSFDYNTKFLGEVLTAVSASLDKTNIRINFTLTNQEGIKERLLASAVANAKADAEILAEASGVKLGKILSISHSYNMVRFDYGSRGERCVSKMAERDCAMASVDSFDNMNVDDLSFEANVNIDWEIL